MPSVARNGVIGKYIELPPELVAAVEALAVQRGHKFREEVIDALRRHVAYPPPVSSPAPLPDVAPADTPAKGKKGKGKRAAGE